MICDLVTIGSYILILNPSQSFSATFIDAVSLLSFVFALKAQPKIATFFSVEDF